MLYSGNAYLDALIVVYIRYAIKKVFMTYRFVLSCLEQGIVKLPSKTREMNEKTPPDYSGGVLNHCVYPFLPVMSPVVSHYLKSGKLFHFFNTES